MERQSICTLNLERIVEEVWCKLIENILKASQGSAGSSSKKVGSYFTEDRKVHIWWLGAAG